MKIGFHVVGTPEAVRAAITRYVPNSSQVLWDAIAPALLAVCKVGQNTPGLEIEVDGYTDGKQTEWVSLRVDIKTVPLVKEPVWPS